MYEGCEVALLRRWDGAKLVDHYAVGFPRGSAWRLGQATAVVVQLLPSEIAVEPWSNGAGWHVLERTTDLEAAVNRLERVTGRGFRLLAWNCEHFARFVVSGRPMSTQVQLVGLATGVACAVALSRGFRR